MTGEKKSVSRVRSARAKVARKKVTAPVVSKTQKPDAQVTEAVNESIAAEQIALTLQSQGEFVKQQLEKERQDAIFFDSQWYLNTYLDIRDAGMEPHMHFIKYGAQEGRNPNALFDSQAYLRANPDAAAFELGPFMHYICYGFREGRALR